MRLRLVFSRQEGIRKDDRPLSVTRGSTVFADLCLQSARYRFPRHVLSSIRIVRSEWHVTSLWATKGNS